MAEFIIIRFIVYKFCHVYMAEFINNKPNDV